MASPPPVDGKYYEVATPNSLAERLVIRARDRIYSDFLRLCQPRPEETILDVGVSDVVGDAANVLERCYPYPDRITAVGLGTAEDFRAAFPLVTYRQVEPNEPLPFADKSFDVATSNAVLEHVGSPQSQHRFVAELMRVARRVFLTVPHRFFPVEHHTAVPLLHWTDTGFALACRLLGKQDWSNPENLILMSRRRLRAVCPRGVRAEIGTTGVPLGPFSGNLYLYADCSTMAPRSREPGRPRTSAVGSWDPRDLGDLDPVLGERLGLCGDRFAVDAAPSVALAAVDAAGFRGEIGADVVAVPLHLRTEPLQNGTDGIGHHRPLLRHGLGLSRG